MMPTSYKQRFVELQNAVSSKNDQIARITEDLVSARLGVKAIYTASYMSLQQLGRMRNIIEADEVDVSDMVEPSAVNPINVSLMADASLKLLVKMVQKLKEMDGMMGVVDLGLEGLDRETIRATQFNIPEIPSPIERSLRMAEKALRDLAEESNDSLEDEAQRIINQSRDLVSGMKTEAEHQDSDTDDETDDEQPKKPESPQPTSSSPVPTIKEPKRDSMDPTETKAQSPASKKGENKTSKKPLQRLGRK